MAAAGSFVSEVICQWVTYNNILLGCDPQ